MKTKKLKILSVIILGFVFDYLFWNQSLGVNTLVFTTLILATILLFTPKKEITSKFILTASGLFLSSILVTITNSYASFFAFWTSLLVFMGIYYRDDIKTSFTAIFATIQKLLSSIVEFFTDLSSIIKGSKFNRFFRFLKISLLPIIIILVFHFIFTKANPVYKDYSAIVFKGINDFIAKIIGAIGWARFFFFITGILLISGIVYVGNREYFNNYETQYQDNIKRKKIKRNFVNFKLTSLKNEYRMASVLVIMINLLLLVLNIIDISWIWFGTVSTDPTTLSQLVHSGTYMLILSIFLSMGIMLYFFRNNLNFYSKNKVLKIGSYVWIFQNVILSISVALRNYHYITNSGLAYKRIGVLIFLILTIVGLILMFNKIRNGKTMFYLIKTNSWSLYMMMLFVAAINWDGIIANYNLNVTYKKNLDVEFINKLSDKALYIVIENSEKIYSSPFYLTSYMYDTSLKTTHKNKVIHFIKNYEEKGWQSWNYADYKSYKELKRIITN